MRITFVHGRAQAGKNPLALQAAWEAAFDEGLGAAGYARPADLEVRFPFYGDALAALVAEVDERTGSRAAREAGAPSPAPHDALRGALVLELAARNGLDEAGIEKHLRRPTSERGPLSWDWVQAILAALDRTPLGGAILDRFTHDVAVYLSYPDVAAQVDAIVADAIGPEPGVVVGHSLGSVIAYDVLRGAAAQVEVPLFLTLGCPLGLDSIRSKLPAPPAHPALVTSWVNAYDERDVVALVPLAGSHFAVSPPVTNVDDVRNPTDDHHGIAGYLERARIGRVLCAGLAA